MSDTTTTPTPATQTQPPIVATPTFRRTTVMDGERVQSMTIYTSQKVVLTKDAAITPAEGRHLDYFEVYTQDDWVTVPISDGADMDVTIHADEVLIYEGLRLPGRNLTIVARTIWVFHERDDDGSAVVIDVSGKNGTKATKVEVGQAPNQVVNGKQIGETAPGGSQGSGTPIKLDIHGHLQLWPIATSNGGPGWSGPDHPEMNGNAGAIGAAGEQGGTITIVTGLLPGVPLDLRANGGDGADGQDGQNGVKGGPGGSGGSAVWPHPYFCVYDQAAYAASNGGPGGKGGNGGAGGPGGPGGACGKITVVAGPQVGINVSLEVGLPGQYGLDGNCGDRGDFGDGGSGYRGSVPTPAGLRTTSA